MLVDVKLARLIPGGGAGGHLSLLSPRYVNREGDMYDHCRVGEYEERSQDRGRVTTGVILRSETIFTRSYGLRTHPLTLLPRVPTFRNPPSSLACRGLFDKLLSVVRIGASRLINPQSASGLWV